MKSPAGEGLIRFNHLISELGALYHEASVRLGLSDSAMNILYTLCVYGDRCQLSEITRLSGVSRQTINSSVHRLKQEGAVYLEFQNGKNKLVCLTDNGRKLIESNVLPLVEMENSVFEEWTQEEQQEFFNLLQKYRSNLRDKLAEYYKTSQEPDYKSKDKTDIGFGEN